MNAAYAIAFLALFSALSALAVFCVQLALRNRELSWGYWLGSVVLGVYALAIAYGGLQVVLFL